MKNYVLGLAAVLFISFSSAALADPPMTLGDFIASGQKAPVAAPTPTYAAPAAQVATPTRTPATMFTEEPTIAKAAPAPVWTAPVVVRQETRVASIAPAPVMRVTVDGEQHQTGHDKRGRTVQYDVHVFCYVFGNQPEQCEYHKVEKEQEDIVDDGYRSQRAVQVGLYAPPPPVVGFYVGRSYSPPRYRDPRWDGGYRGGREPRRGGFRMGGHHGRW